MRPMHARHGLALLTLTAALSACGGPASPTGGPPDPGTFTATASGTTVNLSWSAAQGATNYTLERKTGSAAYARIASPAAGVNTYADTSLSPGTVYTYRLKAVNAAGSSAGKETSATTGAAPGGTDNTALLLGTGIGGFTLDAKQDAPVLQKTDPGDPQPDAPQPGELGAVTCTTQGMSASQVRGLEDTILLNGSEESIYPGALIQGQSFVGGAFQPITIPRAGGTIYLTGLATDPKNPVYRTLPEITASKVAQARQEILATDPRGTEANLDYDSDVTYSQDELLFKVGVDGRYGPAKLKASLKVDHTHRKNFVFVKFQQVFYTLNFQPPEHPTDVFRDGRAFDPGGQIGSGNPAMYVSGVKYGRLVFLVAESEYSKDQLEASLNAAYSGGAAEAKVDGNLTAGQVFSHTNLFYYAVGGDAGQAVGPISADTPEQMFGKVRDLLSDARAARYSADNPGAPIAYTLRYLKDNSVARMSYAATYDQKNCTSTASPPKPIKLEVEFNNIDDSVYAYVNGRTVLFHPADREGKTTGRLDMTPWLTGGDDELQVRLRNEHLWSTSLNMTIYRDGVPVPVLDDKTTRVYAQNYGINGGMTKLDWLYRVNRSTGAVTRLDHFLDDKDCEAKSGTDQCQ